ncbi:C-C motif chemokine 32b.3 [Salminus brasiliensis]|uniref:C-C motif chemokine 32b.3 n=1 Tax=Salminus brasiliensis TaxID=930266 RepID=UPI003B839A77
MNLYHIVFICIASCLCCGTAASWPAHCCLKTHNTRIHVKRFARYTVQTAGLCPINAIVFLTVKGKTLCYNPDLDWVKDAMKKVDQRKGENRGSGSGPASSPKPKNGPRKSQKGKRKGKKRQNQ